MVELFSQTDDPTDVLSIAIIDLPSSTNNNKDSEVKIKRKPTKQTLLKARNSLNSLSKN